jgi:pyridoxal phosphate enzyme (YggS family)
MAVNKEVYHTISSTLKEKGVTLVAVSKTKPVSDILELYELGHRDFGENYVQELVQKWGELPQDIRWHFIGHLQSNKVKAIAPFVHLIHGIDSYTLLKEVAKQAVKNIRVIDVLLQMHIAREESKFGMNEEELTAAIQQYKEQDLKYVQLKGLMGMASFTEDEEIIRQEFIYLKNCFKAYAKEIPQFSILSMGMSSDYTIALEEGSTMVRIGSLLFGLRS